MTDNSQLPAGPDGLAREAMYRAVIETSGDGFFLFDTSGRILEVNAAYMRRSGYSREELLALQLADLEARESPSEITAHMEQISREGSDTFETLHRTKDGTVWPVEVTASYWRHDGGRFFCFLRDIARRKRSEALLKTRVVLSELADRGTIDELLHQALDAAELHTGSSIGFFHFVDADQETLTLQTWSTNTLRSMCNAEGKGKHYPIHEAGVWVDCVYRRAPVIHNDYEGLAHKKGMPEGHATVVRELVVPVIRGEKIISIMGVGNKTSDYSQEDVEAVQVIASLVMDLVSRKQAEAALKESQAQLTRAQLVARLGNWDWDFVTNRQRWSDENYRIFGIAPNTEPSYDAFMRTVLPEEREQVNQALADALAGRRRLDIDLMIVRPDSGEHCIVNVKADVIRDSRGSATKMLGTVQDITERKRVEQALRESEQLYRNLVETTAAVAWEVDIATLQFTYISPQIMELSGYPAEQWRNFEFWSDKIYPADREYAVRFCQAETARGIDHAFEYRMVTADGRTIWVRDVVSVILQEGRPVTLRGYFINITASKEAEEKIRRSEEFVRSILDTVDEGFIVIDPDFRILTANKAYCLQVGGSDETVRGKHCYEVSHNVKQPCFRDGEHCAVQRVFETGRPHAAFHCHKDAGGSLLYVETRAFPIKDEAGRITSVIETINDITEKYLLEEERLKTQKLESIGTLAGGIAHDFNNLLQGVFGYISMAKMTLDDREKAQAMLEQAEEALHLSVNLTTQLLTFSKGGKPLTKLINLKPVIDNAVKFALSGSSTDYRLDLAADLWPVEADEGQLAQVIQNIVLNANEAMAGSGTVYIKAGNLDRSAAAALSFSAGRRFVRIDVQDSGTGIPGQNLPKIFDPYFTTKQKGSGLGLATSYSIIRNHGGEIEVKSELNKGSLFTLYLPAAEQCAQEEKPVAAAPAVARSGRILLMDDEDLVRKVAAEMVAALGHQVESARDGQQAIALFRQARDAGNPYDLLILDLTIKGGMGGEEALQKIRELDPTVKAVVSSGYADNPVVAHYLDCGFTAFLNKPYKLAALKDCLDSCLQ